MASNPHIYVSGVHGTNTGGSDTSYASQQTGNITALTAGNVYADIGAAITGTSPSAGDVIYVASNHAATYDNGGNVVVPEGVHIISVDDTNIDQYEPGASENLSDTADDFYFQNNCLSAGVSYETGDDVIRATGHEPSWVMQDGTITVDGTGDYAFYIGADGGSVKLLNIDIDSNASNADIFGIINGCVVDWHGGSLLSTRNDMFGAFGSGGGATLLIEGVDLSPCANIHPSIGRTADNTLVRLKHCKLNASVNLPSSASFGSLYQRFEMFNCDDGTGDALHRFMIADIAGVAKNNDSTYVTAGEAWYEGSAQSSIEVTTSADCKHSCPFVFEIPAQYVNLSEAGSDVLTLDLVTDSTALSLTDTDIAAFLVYPDGTTALQANWVTSGKSVGAGNYGNDPLSAGTALSASALGAADWTGEPASANFYKMELDTSGDAGQATAVSIRIEVYKANIAAGDLFIHPILTLS